MVIDEGEQRGKVCSRYVGQSATISNCCAPTRICGLHWVDFERTKKIMLGEMLIPLGDTYPAACDGIRGSGPAPRFIPLIFIGLVIE